ncbi:unnamed protein product [Linum trigynum]|uniref:Uncharacterized protein n=1 Tax=Linum trigynum TaxID=586398 RepID=A0AAV2FC46_9ROSI
MKGVRKLNNVFTICSEANVHESCRLYQASQYRSWRIHPSHQVSLPSEKALSSEKLASLISPDKHTQPA